MHLIRGGKKHFSVNNELKQKYCGGCWWKWWGHCGNSCTDICDNAWSRLIERLRDRSLIDCHNCSNHSFLTCKEGFSFFSECSNFTKEFGTWYVWRWPSWKKSIPLQVECHFCPRSPVFPWQSISRWLSMSSSKNVAIWFTKEIFAGCWVENFGMLLAQPVRYDGQVSRSIRSTAMEWHRKTKEHTFIQLVKFIKNALRACCFPIYESWKVVDGWMDGWIFIGRQSESLVVCWNRHKSVISAPIQPLNGCPSNSHALNRVHQVPPVSISNVGLRTPFSLSGVLLVKPKTLFNLKLLNFGNTIFVWKLFLLDIRKF